MPDWLTHVVYCHVGSCLHIGRNPRRPARPNHLTQATQHPLHSRQRRLQPPSSLRYSVPHLLGACQVDTPLCRADRLPLRLPRIRRRTPEDRVADLCKQTVRRRVVRLSCAQTRSD